jgi:hypothetical protein
VTLLDVTGEQCRSAQERYRYQCPNTVPSVHKDNDQALRDQREMWCSREGAGDLGSSQCKITSARNSVQTRTFRVEDPLVQRDVRGIVEGQVPSVPDQ